MPHISSFKAQYRQVSPRTSTPPRPVLEPLSPLLGSRAPSAALHAGHGVSFPNSAPATLPASSEASRSYNPLTSTLSAVHQESPRDLPVLSSSLLPCSWGSSSSPIEAPTDVTVPPQHISPARPEPVHHTLYATTPYSPVTCLHSMNGSVSKQTYPRVVEDSLHSYNQRPTKRARSEFYGLPPCGVSQSRPATSHIPDWSYNVEHMVDNRMRMYQDIRASALASHQSSGANDRLSDAQLLLNFFTVSAHTARSPPSAGREPGVSRAAASEAAKQQIQPARGLIKSHSTLPYDLDKSIQLPQGLSNAHPSGEVEATMIPRSRTPLIETHTPPSIVAPRDDVCAGNSNFKKRHDGSEGKLRSSRNVASISKRKKQTLKLEYAPASSTFTAMHRSNPMQSLPTEHFQTALSEDPTLLPQRKPTAYISDRQTRRHSSSSWNESLSGTEPRSIISRAQSLPIDACHAVGNLSSEAEQPVRKTRNKQPVLTCAACKSSESEVKISDGEQWIGCDGCKEWYHYACAGFSKEREVREINKFYCEPCRPRFGETTKVRKSVRTHTTVDYAGLNEGVLKTSDDNPEHHYIAAFKNGDMDFSPESFARIPPELITSDFLEKTSGFKEPLLIPGALNSQSERAIEMNSAAELCKDPGDSREGLGPRLEHDLVEDDGQDRLDMVIPAGLTVRRVAELYGLNEPVPVIDVKAQEGEGKKWTMGQWADYYEQQGEKPVRNVISLEVSRSRLGKLIRRPRAVRDMDLQDSVWRDDDKWAPPPVQFYCLMSVADCFTDFHIDFGGSSVYYHIVKGKKVFFFIPPTRQNLKKYEDWCLSPNQGHDWLGKQVKDCYRVDLYPGDTMLIPSGWIHAVWTPEDSLVIGGNFLTRIHYGMQIKILEIEKNTKVALRFRYPFFQKIMWLAAIKYLEDDPIPQMVQELLLNKDKFQRCKPIYCEPDRFGQNSRDDAANYNSRYYSKHELDGLPDLLNYLWRTVLISLDKVDVPQRTRSAVSKSIPKGHGEPLAIARCLAIWIAWKRGNETVPSWALPDATLPEAIETGEKKLNAVRSKRLQRGSLSEVLRTSAERVLARTGATDPVLEPSLPDELESDYRCDSASTSGHLTGFLRTSANNPHITTPKTSQLGPKRVACDACRKRRIRCKHKDELIDVPKPGMHTIDLSGSYGISVKRRLSDHSVTDGQINVVNCSANGGPIMADANGDPYALKSGRVKACADCRKSKRRCIHDEYGNVDPIKVNEVPVPRGSISKKQRVSDDDPTIVAERIDYQLPYDEEFINGETHAQQSSSSQFDGNSFLQDLAYSAQRALDHNSDDDPVPIDPALEVYANGTYPNAGLALSFHHNCDSIVTSIEYRNGGSVRTETNGFSGQQDEPYERSVESSATKPLSRSCVNNSSISGLNLKTDNDCSLTRCLSSPMLCENGSMTPPVAKKQNGNAADTAGDNDNMIFTNSDIPPTSSTPVAYALPSVHDIHNVSYKSSTTSSHTRRHMKISKPISTSRRRDGKDGIGSGHNPGVGMPGTIGDKLDQASIDLIKQLQQDDLGLRRRSR